MISKIIAYPQATLEEETSIQYVTQNYENYASETKPLKKANGEYSRGLGKCWACEHRGFQRQECLE